MTNIWVCKPDGTIQCDEDSKEITLEKMRDELASIIGEDNIVSMKKTSRPMIQLCGMPTGSMNAYEITERGAFILERGIVGRQGFNPCSPEKYAQSLSSEVNIGQVIGSLTSCNPTTVKELTGHPLRVYKTGDFLTRDWRPDRVNIEVNNEGIIVDIWFG
ncbi:MAG: hypothetical protein H0X43_01860 [Nitrosospira sp.]|nr:hypothetical protein [Nitrosospira sp.]